MCGRSRHSGSRTVTAEAQRIDVGYSSSTISRTLLCPPAAVGPALPTSPFPLIGSALCPSAPLSLAVFSFRSSRALSPSLSLRPSLSLPIPASLPPPRPGLVAGGLPWPSGSPPPWSHIRCAGPIRTLRLSGSGSAGPPAPDPVPGPRLPARCVLLFQPRTNRSARHTRPACSARLAAALGDQVRTNSRTSARTALVLRACSSCPSHLLAGPPCPPLPPGRTSAQLSLSPGPIRWLRRVPLLQPRPPSHRLAHHTHPQLPPAAPPPTHAATPTANSGSD